MSVLIKGMEMLKDCRECPMQVYYSSGKTWCKSADMILAENHKPIPFDGRPDWCPLVELPEKHGRLIDADTLIKALIRKEPFNDCARVVIAECMEEVRHAPTVIETEDDE